ncbi:MAG TPA: hypothetical protein VFU36_07175 [Jatrophihabitans sp.]|nr:hypothetical protein [Jatrophihabitans sp.]
MTAPASRSGVLGRAVAASAALVLGVATATGIFVAKIARSYANPGTGTGLTNGPGTDDGAYGGTYDGFGQISSGQQDQQLSGRSHGS